MKVMSIMYHDIVADGDFDSSGFLGNGAELYKLGITDFESHLSAIATLPGCMPGLVTQATGQPMCITFDDGGRGAITHAAAALEAHGWRGHFFVPTDFIDSPKFLARTEIVEMHARGHIIGSHSASHPLRMGACSPDRLRDEWTRSTDVLSDLLQAPVTVASVPGGMFTQAVAVAAHSAGIRHLFTSEPITTSWMYRECRMYGRYTIFSTTRSAQTLSLMRGDVLARFRQFAIWNGKKLAKRIGGEGYLTLRRRLLERNK